MPGKCIRPVVLRLFRSFVRDFFLKRFPDRFVSYKSLLICFHLPGCNKLGFALWHLGAGFGWLAHRITVIDLLMDFGKITMVGKNTTHHDSAILPSFSAKEKCRTRRRSCVLFLRSSVRESKNTESPGYRPDLLASPAHTCNESTSFCALRLRSTAAVR